jgi:hypothetical protein
MNKSGINNIHESNVINKSTTYNTTNIKLIDDYEFNLPSYIDLVKLNSAKYSLIMGKKSNRNR